MINVYDTSNNAHLCAIREEQLEYLQSELEEEFLEDQDYAITGMELDYFEGQLAQEDSPARAVPGLDELLHTLRQALGNREEMIIRWLNE